MEFVYNFFSKIFNMEIKPSDGDGNINDLPEDAFLYILSWVPAKDLVKQCSLVSKWWCSMSRNNTVWSLKCEREKVFISGVMGPIPSSFMQFYFQQPYTRNLLKNDRALAGLQYWTAPRRTVRRGCLEYDEANAPEVEDEPFGSNPITDYVQVNGPIKNWVTSFQYGEMVQEIDLLVEGCTLKVLDDIKPHIHVLVWCSARSDCGSKFHFCVKLVDNDEKELDRFEEEKVFDEDNLRRIWHQVEHTFKDYRPGLRRIIVKMGGVDTQFWLGNYGSKFTLPSVKFIFP